jgi:hypothetical protein
MPTYVVRGNIYFTQEYGYVYQIEADTPEDASEKFQELMTSRNFPSDLEFSESGDPAQNQGGTYMCLQMKMTQRTNLMHLSMGTFEEC